MSKIIHKNPKFGQYLEKLDREYRKNAEKPSIKIGFPSGKVPQKYPDGTSVIDVAVWNNYGTDTIPERPFLSLSRFSIIAETKEQRITAIRMLQGVRDGKMQIEDLIKKMNQIGAKSSAVMKRVITELSDPPNAPSTIEKKGSDNPLIDIGLLRSSVTWSISLPDGLQK